MTMIIAILSILHGLAHLWYVTLGLRFIEFTPAMVWTGESWLLNNVLREEVTRTIAAVLYGFATVGIILGGVGLALQQQWFRPAMIIGCLISALSILLYWDGDASKLVQKGLIGFLLSMGLLTALVIFGWPSEIRQY